MDVVLLYPATSGYSIRGILYLPSIFRWQTLDINSLGETIMLTLFVNAETSLHKRYLARVTCIFCIQVLI